MRRAARAAWAALSLVASLTSAEEAWGAQELGLNVHQSVDLGLDVTADAGLGWVRIDLNWVDAQPDPGPPDFTFFDTLVDAALARGLQVLAVVGYGPAWASSGDGLGDGSHNDVPLPGSYEAFVTAVVQHFAGRVTHYELWNEPNLDVFFEGTPSDFTTHVLVPGAAALHQSCSECKVVAPALASIGDEYDVWLDASLAAAKDDIDIVSGHIYAGFHDDLTSDSFFHKLEEHRVVEVNGAVVFEGPLAFREVMAQHGVTAPFWLTEVGREAAPGDPSALGEQRVLYRKVLEAMLSRPWWEATLFYEAFDNSDLFWGVAWPDAAAAMGYQPKPVMELLQKVTASSPAFGGDGFVCDDGLDNDGDDLVDYPEDPDCTTALGASEGSHSGGGAGGGGGGGGGDLGGAGGEAAAPDEVGCGCRLGPVPRARPGWLVALVVGLVLRRRGRSGRERA
ncbi:MAG: hypothetical protein KC731_13400 [Myxococcales bacterium]|nr:hypothetical protein [Myxococcales bacterium]